MQIVRGGEREVRRDTSKTKGGHAKLIQNITISEHLDLALVSLKIDVIKDIKISPLSFSRKKKKIKKKVKKGYDSMKILPVRL